MQRHEVFIEHLGKKEIKMFLIISLTRFRTILDIVCQENSAMQDVNSLKLLVCV